MLTATACCLAASLGVATAASGQTRPAPPTKNAGPGHEFELVVGGLFTSRIAMGSADANLIAPDGSNLVLFRTENSFGPGAGLELDLGFRVSKTFRAEASGTWLRVNARTRISSDFESASDQTLSSPVDRLTLEGAGLWTFRETTKTAWFARGSAGWMREFAGGYTLSKNGAVGSGGVGVRHWWRSGSKGTIKRMGVRAEFRAVFRSGGLALGTSSSRLGVAGVGHVVFGF
jgi:hypothetical protein